MFVVKFRFPTLKKLPTKTPKCPSENNQTIRINSNMS